MNGYKRLELRHNADHLRSVLTRQVWVDNKLTAECLHRRYNVDGPKADVINHIPERHRSPHELCTCGIWSWTREGVTNRLSRWHIMQVHTYHRYVTVRVEISGLVVPYSEGYRSEHAEITGVLPLNYVGRAKAWIEKANLPVLEGFFLERKRQIILEANKNQW